MTGRCQEPAAGPSTGGRGLCVIFKGTERCNGACRFCSVGPARGPQVTWENFVRISDALDRHAHEAGLERIDFTFHGGEPTLLGPAFLARACERLRRLAVPVTFHMQSNLLALNHAFLEVAREHRIQIGSSIDPVNAGRATRRGDDVFARWRKNYARLVQAGFAVGSIFVVTRAALGQVRRLYASCEELAAEGPRPGLQVNPVYPQGLAAGGREQLIQPEELRDFLVDLWRLWNESGRSIDVTPLRQFADWIEGGSRGSPRLPCGFRGECHETHVGIDHALRVAGCGRRLDSGAFFGSLRDASLQEILDRSPERAVLRGRTDALRAGECAACEIFEACRGGCPDDAVLTNGDLTRRTPWCGAWRGLLEAMSAVLRGRRQKNGSGRRPIRGDTDPGVAVPPGSDFWLLPTPRGEALRYDAPFAALPKALGPGSALWIWIHNRHARSLALWRDVVRDRRVSVVLFESEGLASALNVANALGARVELDVAGIAAQTGGPDALQQALARYLRDPMWRSELRPFTAMLRAAVDGNPLPLAGRLGIAPGSRPCSFAVDPQEPLVHGALEAISMTAEPGCGSPACEHESHCRGRLAATPGVPCTGPLLSLATTLRDAAADIRARIGAEPGARS